MPRSCGITEWFPNNVFNSLGNYFICFLLGTPYSWSFFSTPLQGTIYRKRQCSEALHSKIILEVEEQNLGERLVMLHGCELSLMAWRKQLPRTATVTVCHPQAHHGNAGRLYTLLKRIPRQTSLLSLPLIHSQMEESANSTSATQFLLSNVWNIQTPKRV